MQRGGETTDASHPQSQYQQAAISYEELAICNKQTSNREEMAILATGISFQEWATNSLQSPFIICAIVYPWKDHKFNISYQEKAIGNEYHQLETISNKAAGGAAIINAASRWQRKATAQRITRVDESEVRIVKVLFRFL